MALFSRPIKDIHTFVGTFTTYESETQRDVDSHIDALTVDNTLWTNTVVASGTAVGLVIYTGSESRRSVLLFCLLFGPHSHYTSVGACECCCCLVAEHGNGNPVANVFVIVCSVMNTSQPHTKVGLIDQEINFLAKVLFIVTFALALVLVSLKVCRCVVHIVGMAMGRVRRTRTMQTQYCSFKVKGSRKLHIRC